MHRFIKRYIFKVAYIGHVFLKQNFTKTNWSTWLIIGGHMSLNGYKYNKYLYFSLVSTTANANLSWICITEIYICHVCNYKYVIDENMKSRRKLDTWNMISISHSMLAPELGLLPVQSGQNYKPCETWPFNSVSVSMMTGGITQMWIALNILNWQVGSENCTYTTPNQIFTKLCFAQVLALTTSNLKLLLLSYVIIADYRYVGLYLLWKWKTARNT